MSDVTTYEYDCTNLYCIMYNLKHPHMDIIPIPEKAKYVEKHT